MHGYCSSNCLCTQHLLQCQSQLKRLYAEGIKGCYFEFSAYNLLCVMLHSNNKRDLLSSLARYYFIPVHRQNIDQFLFLNWPRLTYSLFSGYRNKPNKMKLSSMPLQFILLFHLETMSYFSNYTSRHRTWILASWVKD